MAGPTPAFTGSFLVEENNYGDFIRVVRKDVIKYCSDKRPSIVQPVLPPEQAVPSRWFYVVLRNTKTSSSSITLAIRMDNLYLVGFKTPAGVWWEFGEERDTRLIAGSRWLGFGGRYQDLVGQKDLDTVTLGRAQMATAVDLLAKHAPADQHAVPKSMLAKLVIMISEGLRFLTVSGTVDAKFDVVNSTITAMEGKQVNKASFGCLGVVPGTELTSTGTKWKTSFTPIPDRSKSSPDGFQSTYPHCSVVDRLCWVLT